MSIHRQINTDGRESKASNHLMTVETLLLTPEDACTALNIGRTRLYELLASGELRSVTIGPQSANPDQCGKTPKNRST